MTDYLEPLTEDNVDALLEEARRLSAALSGLGPGLELELEESFPARAGREAARGEGGMPSPALPGEGTELKADGSVYRAAEEVLGTDVSVSTREEDCRAANNLPETVGPQRPGRTAAPWRDWPDGEERPSALLTQLERLDRAAALPLEGGSASRPQSGESGNPRSGGRRTAMPGVEAPSVPGWPEVEPGQLGAWGSGPVPERDAPLPGGEIRWAERADRAFRRDSRRYDGGFYLY